MPQPRRVKSLCHAQFSGVYIAVRYGLVVWGCERILRLGNDRQCIYTTPELRGTVRVGVDSHDSATILQRQGLYAWSDELDRLHINVNDDVWVFARSLFVIHFHKWVALLSFKFLFDIVKADG
jgi:hypothetical protein